MNDCSTLTSGGSKVPLNKSKKAIKPSIRRTAVARMARIVLLTVPGTVIQGVCGAVVVANLYSFENFTTGAYPESALVQGSDGDFYGTTYYGGTNGYGTVFKVSAGGAFASLYSFTNGADGETPDAPLIQGSDGYFYGTTSFGGTNGGDGTVFKMSANGVLINLHCFSGGDDCRYPDSGVVQGSDGNLYGTTYGTSTWGTVFKISTNGTLTTLYAFTGDNDGGGPWGGLVQGRDGYFYGVTEDGGANFAGTAFKITTNGVLTTLHPFAIYDGANPEATMVQGSDGYLYGTTSGGGSYSFGTIFKMSTNGTLASLYSFTGGPDGESPSVPLVQGSDGNFYGATTYGGASGYGTLFSISAGGTFTTLYTFPGGSGGAYPNGLVQGRDGSFYGTTLNSGTSGYGGTVFRLSVGLGPGFPVIQTGGATLGVMSNRFGFIITWSTNRPVVVQACTNIVNPVWTSVSTNAVVNGTNYFSDPNWMNYRMRFYRLATPD